MIRRVLPFVFAAVLGLVGVLMTRRYIAQQLVLQQRAFRTEREKLMAEYQQLAQSLVEVIVARTDIPEDSTVTASHLDLQAVPQNYVQPYATTRATDVMGLVAIAPIAKGEQVLRNKLRPAEEVVSASTLSELTPEGKRAVTIGTDMLTGVGGLIHPGDRVDVLWTFEPPQANGEGPGEAVTVTLFQNVPVLAVGDQLVGATAKEGEGTSRDNTVTVALTPQETSLLLYARRQGVVQLSLRPRAEGEVLADLSPTDMTVAVQSLLQRDLIRESRKRIVEVIRGLEQSVVAIDE